MSAHLAPARNIRVDALTTIRSTSSLRAFAKISLPSGITVADVAIHVANGRAWASPPSKPMLDRGGAALRDDTGKIRYSPIIGFTSKELRDRFSAGVIEAVRLGHPDVLVPSE